MCLWLSEITMNPDSDVLCILFFIPAWLPHEVPLHWPCVQQCVPGHHPSCWTPPYQGAGCWLWPRCQRHHGCHHCLSATTMVDAIQCLFITSTKLRRNIEMPSICPSDIYGILPKGPFAPCWRMADRALLAGYSLLVFVHHRVLEYWWQLLPLRLQWNQLIVLSEILVYFHLSKYFLMNKWNKNHSSNKKMINR